LPSSISQGGLPTEIDGSDLSKAAAPSILHSRAEPIPTPAQTPLEALSAGFQIDGEAVVGPGFVCRTRRGSRRTKAHRPSRVVPARHSPRCSPHARGSTLQELDRLPSQLTRAGSHRCPSTLLPP